MTTVASNLAPSSVTYLANFEKSFGAKGFPFR